MATPPINNLLFNLRLFCQAKNWECGWLLLIYFDHYHNPQYYGALESKDFKQWQDLSTKVSFPKGHRHGPVLQISEQALGKLLDQYRER